VGTLVYVGVDPGFGELGCVGIDEDRQVIFGATWRAPKWGPDLERANGLARSWAKWFLRNKPADSPATVAFELPVMTGSPAIFAKQWRLLAMLQQYLFLTSSVRVPERKDQPIWLVEVTPTESKKALTGHGGAEKQDMIDSSPFTELDNRKVPSRSTLECLADSYGHAVAAMKPGRERVLLCDLNPTMELEAYYRVSN